jgi:ABC-2 type transport system ATP-binding protein
LKDAVLSLRAGGATVVFSTHDMSVAERLCDAVLMIYRGRKVLDGTLSEIQRRYPVNRLRFRLAGDIDLPERLPGVAATSRTGRFIEATLDSAEHAQSVLRQVAQVRDVEHFELVRPTLHDIFVDIARPNLASENGQSGEASRGAPDA